MLSTIVNLLTFRKKSVVTLERREPVFFTKDEDLSFEASLEKEFSHTAPSPALNPAYLESMTQARQA